MASPQPLSTTSGTSSAVVVVPCYNEERRLDVSSFVHFSEYHQEIKFVFVDDGSTDNTLQALESLSRARPEIFSVVHLDHNLGKAEAVRLGLLRACEMGFPYVGFWDADLSTPLDAIPAFCFRLDQQPQLEMIFGTRIQLLGRFIIRSTMRHYLGRFFATAVSYKLGVPTYDTQCGAKLFRVSDDLRRILSQPFRSRWIFDVEIAARALQLFRNREVGTWIYELPLMRWCDVGGSKLHWYDFFRAAMDLARLDVTNPYPSVAQTGKRGAVRRRLG